ncbi:SGNH/GDSL hydrolase family protein [uncultured Gimesia sp.]|uniref:SGNH/GDSL hydrolase family protein n=1 Tax=uncultured Gimesia sp. TaxID=1678688 RepID=UPI0030D7F7F9|tara:strand:+ start:2196 stop:3005 length:810 start_codon:yes stop_codon:yes gene_type:complete
MNDLEVIENPRSQRPVILLGASNLTRDFPLILRLLQTSIDSPTDIFTAMGHGRSYGAWSRLLHRALPGITKSELWDALPERTSESHQPLALLTDIGNDLIYGQSTDTIFGWVKDCVRQLQQIDARITITLLPEESLSRLSNLRFELTRRLFFPTNPASLTDLIQKVQRLNQQLLEFAVSNQICIVEASQDWYGFDPIHYRYSQRTLLWKLILSTWPLPQLEHSPAKQRWYDTFYSVFHLKPALKRQWGKTHHTPQPTRILSDGTRISMY